MGSPLARPEGRIPPRCRDYFRFQPRFHRVLRSPVRAHVRHLRPQGRTECEDSGVASRLPRHGIYPRLHGPHGPRNPGSPCTKPHLPGPAELPSSSKPAKTSPARRRSLDDGSMDQTTGRIHRSPFRSCIFLFQRQKSVGKKLRN